MTNPRVLSRSKGRGYLQIWGVRILFILPCFKSPSNLGWDDNMTDEDGNCLFPFLGGAGRKLVLKVNGR